MIGKRKHHAFFFTMIIYSLIIVGAFLAGVQFSGDNIMTIGFTYVGAFGMYAGANYGEWVSKAKSNNLPK